MKTMRELHLLGVLAALLVAVVFFTPAAAEARPTIHALLIIEGANHNPRTTQWGRLECTICFKQC